jgi:hypothetical protein
MKLARFKVKTKPYLNVYDVINGSKNPLWVPIGRVLLNPTELNASLFLERFLEAILEEDLYADIL